MLDLAHDFHEVPTATGAALDFDDAFEDVDVQLKIDGFEGEWHRFVLNGARMLSSYGKATTELRTACGRTVTGAYMTRDPDYGGNLCKHGCFSPYELKLNADALAAVAEQKRLDLLKHGGRTQSQRTRVRIEDRRWAEEQRERLLTERMQKLNADDPDPEDKP